MDTLDKLLDNPGLLTLFSMLLVGAVVAVAFIICLLRPSSAVTPTEEAAKVEAREASGGSRARTVPAQEDAKPKAEAAAAAAGGGKKKKKKAKKKKATPTAVVEQPEVVAEPEPAPEPEPEPEPEPAAVDPGTGGGGKKKKKKKKKGKAAAGGGGGGNASSNATKPAATNESETKNNAADPVEEHEQEEHLSFAEAAARKEQEEILRQILQQQKAAADDDGWAAVPNKKKKKGPKKKAVSASAPNAAANPNAESKSTVTVEARKVGIIIGPKGATMQSIQTATDTKIEINSKQSADDAPVAITVTGKAEDVKRAELAIQELCDKGYTMATQEVGFQEQSVNVHPSVLNELVGPGGSVIRALQDNLSVKITIPPTDWRPGDRQKAKPAKVGVAGSRESCIKAKAAIQQISRYHHHPITHPGLVHHEVDVPPEYYHAVIGTRGSEIRHIKGNYSCDVHIPNDDSYSECVIVVGKPAMVGKAVLHIENLMVRASQQHERTYDDDYY